MSSVKAFPLNVHDKAKLSIEDFEDRLELKLVNNDTGKESNRTYYKLDDITIDEAVKIDTIIYFMHNEIDLDLWEGV